MDKKASTALAIGLLVIMSFDAPHRCMGQEYHEKGGYRLTMSHYDGAFVEGFDVNGMAKVLLPGFRMDFQLAIRYYGILYSFIRETDNRRCLRQRKQLWIV